jgi:translation initiation factor IF-3
LKDENRVKATVIFRGREITHSELGEEILNQLRGELVEVAEIERTPRLEGHTMTMILVPRKQP